MSDAPQSKKVDLTYQEDLSFAVMNLISIEEHLAMTSAKTSREEYLHVLGAVRKLRISLLKQLVPKTEGETWCISKHLLSSTMRLMESATKYMESDVSRAHGLEKSAWELYSLFWLVQKLAEGPEPVKSEAPNRRASPVPEPRGSKDAARSKL